MARWNDLWFRPIPPHIYAVLRALFGVLCILDLLGATPVSMFWDPNGIVPLPGGGLGLRAWVVESGFGGTLGQLFFWGTLLVYAAMTVGLAPQLTVVAGFAATIFQSAWNLLPLSSAHQVLTVVLFALVWADCGSALTITRRPVPPPPRPIAPLRLIQYQVALIYFSSGVSKFAGGVWRDGSAVYYALTSNVVQRWPLDAMPPVLQDLSILATYGTLVFELGFPLLVWGRRTRALVLWAGVMLHLGVWLTLEVGPFSWVMTATYVAFLDPEYVARLVQGSVSFPLRARTPTDPASPA